MTHWTGSRANRRGGDRRAGSQDAPGSPAAAALGGCAVEQTVTDGSGVVIDQKPVVEVPFGSEEKKRERIEENERKLGW